MVVYGRENEKYFSLSLQRFFFFKVKKNKAKITIIHIKTVTSAGDYEQTFNYKRPYALVAPHKAVLNPLH